MQSIIQLMIFSLLMLLLILNWIGSCPVENPFIITGKVFTIMFMYFSYFLMMPEMLKLWNKMNT